MARALQWKNLVLGFVSALVVVTLGVLILVFGRAGELHGKKFTLFVTTDGARGVIKGTEVWLDGQHIGIVSDVGFRPPSVSADERLVLKLSLLSHAHARIRGDSRVQVRAGLTILGDPVVALNSGSLKQPEMREGDTIHAGVQVDVEGVMSDAAIASREFPAIMQNVKLLMLQLRTAQGTLAAFGVDKTPRFAAFEAHASHVMSLFGDTTGTFGLAMRPQGLDLPRAAASHAMAQVDSIRALLGSNRHSLGRFRRDSTLRIELGRIRAELAEVERMMSNPNGTIGRFRADSALLRSVARDRAAVDSLVADMKRHPIRYVAF